jgi:hypothetical protein
MDLTDLPVRDHAGLQYVLSPPAPTECRQNARAFFVHGYDESTPSDIHTGLARHGPLRVGMRSHPGSTSSMRFAFVPYSGEGRDDAVFDDRGADHVGAARIAYEDEQIYCWLLSKRLRCPDKQEARETRGRR